MNIFDISTSKKIAIALYNAPDFYTQTINVFSFLNAQDWPNTGRALPSFNYGESNFVDQMNDLSTNGPYYFGAVKNYSIKPINYYKSVSTFTYSKFFEQPQNNVLKTDGALNLPVILPYDNNSNNFLSLFTEVIYRLSAFPFVPFFIYSSVAAQNNGGPLFVRNFSINASSNRASEINLSFLGGTYFTPSEDIGTQIDNYFPFGSTGRSQVYRTGQIFDCLFALNYVPIESTDNISLGTSPVYTAYNANTIWWSNQNNINIIDMKLEINQDLHEVYTSNDGISKNISDGMNSISMKNRSVKGMIKFVASKDFTSIFNTQSLILYFGGPFYYPMNNVYFQLFGLDINENEYTHSFEFEALLQPTSNSQWYKQNIFDLNYSILSKNIKGGLYFDPQ